MTLAEFEVWVCGREDEHWMGWRCGDAWQDAINCGAVKDKYDIDEARDTAANEVYEYGDGITLEEFLAAIDNFPFRRSAIRGWEMIQHTGSPEFEEKRERVCDLLDMGEARMAVSAYRDFLMDKVDNADSDVEEMLSIIEAECEYREDHYWLCQR